MKYFSKPLLLILLIATNAIAAEPLIEQDKYDLACDIGTICLEQSLKNAKHNFHVEPGSTVRVEVKAKSGASLTLVSGGNTMSASYLSVGTKEVEKQSVELEAQIDKTGNFTLDVTAAKITINGKPQNADGAAYILKITRLPTEKAKDLPGDAI